jgi:hypothetical protein
MPQITSSQLRTNQPVEANSPDTDLVINIDPGHPLPVGGYTFQLEVVDNSGNRSQAVQLRLFVVDTQAPTAIISAPRTVPFGQPFTLSGRESADAGGGSIIKFIWTLIQ